LAISPLCCRIRRRGFTLNPMYVWLLLRGHRDWSRKQQKNLPPPPPAAVSHLVMMRRQWPLALGASQLWTGQCSRWVMGCVAVVGHNSRNNRSAAMPPLARVVGRRLAMATAGGLPSANNGARRLAASSPPHRDGQMLLLSTGDFGCGERREVQSE
jgi:hypothetical protein